MQIILENPAFVLFAILFFGLALGNISIKGIALGSSGVLFVALAAGHFKLTIPAGVSDIGTALFVYCVGLGVGNRFFSSLRSKGKNIVILALVIVLAGWLTALGLCTLLGIDLSIAAGIFAGACTSTPALAAALDAAKAAGLNESVINIGYGVAYPIGVIGIVLFVQLLPRILGQSLAATKAGAAPDPHAIIAQQVCVTNPEAIGRNPEALLHTSHASCRVTRICRGDTFYPLQPNDVLAENDVVLMIGERGEMEHSAGLFGHVVGGAENLRLPQNESAELIVLSPAMNNMSLRELNPLHRYGIGISRISRLGNTFVPTADTEILRNDVLRVVGSPQAIENFKKECGHRSAAFNMADMISIMGGLMLGILLGKLTFSFGDGDGFSLGMAGGPLIMALILGHFGRLGPIVGYIPRPSRMLLMDFGLMLFLAGAGIRGGEKLVATLMENGLSMFLVGTAITTLPLFIGYFVARKFLKMDVAETLGCICGSQTSTPALGAITAQTDSQDPVIAYSTAYPIALILMSILAQILVQMA